MSKRDHYEVLGVGRDADPEELKRAYRQVAKQFHPDLNNGDKEAAERFKEASEAYEVLRDPEKRAIYDRYGHEGLSSRGMSSGASSMEDIFDIFASVFGGGRERTSRVNRGRSIRLRVSLTLEEAAQGKKESYSFNRHEVCEACGGSGSEKGHTSRSCPTCGGRGQVQVSLDPLGIISDIRTCSVCRGRGKLIEHPCHSCAGHGLSLKKVSVPVEIPPGAESGWRISVQGEGEASAHGGPRGDLVVEVTVEDHPVFVREGENLFTDLPITFTQAALGATVQIPTIEGDTVDLKIPAGTQTHQMLRIAGKGMPIHREGMTIFRRRRHGDLYVRVRIVTPEGLSKGQREILERLAQEESGVNTPSAEPLLHQGHEGI
jgi:molecular chaperone DnaJ